MTDLLSIDSMMEKIRTLPEDMARMEARTMKFMGSAEVAAGAALLHRGMMLLREEMAFVKAIRLNGTANGSMNETYSDPNQHEIHEMHEPGMNMGGPGGAGEGVPPIMMPHVDEAGTAPGMMDQGNARFVQDSNMPQDEEEEDVAY